MSKIYSHFKTTDPIIKVSGSDFKQIAVFNYYIILTASLLILGNIVNLLIWVPILHLNKYKYTIRDHIIKMENVNCDFEEGFQLFNHP